MSLSRTIDRLARAIRVEAKRNPEFARRLEEIFAAHAARAPERDAPPQPEIAAEPPHEPPPASKPAAAPAPRLNPVAIVSRQGADALQQALQSPEMTETALRALVAEHNLDPAGETGALGREALADHILAQAKRRVERDRKLFDY